MGKADFLKLGEYNMICDRCGFKYKSSEIRKEWDGLMVCGKCWEPRQPQDFVRGVKDDQHVPVSRPDSDPTFVATAPAMVPPAATD